MTKTMHLELYYSEWGGVQKDILYHGSLEEIASSIEHDENSLLEFMQTRDIKGCRVFCFAGFMFVKDGLIAAQFTEPDI